MKKLSNLQAGEVKTWLMSEALAIEAKSLLILFMRYKQTTYSVFHLDMVIYCQSELYIWLSLKTTVAFVDKLGAVVSF